MKKHFLNYNKFIHSNTIFFFLIHYKALYVFSEVFCCWSTLMYISFNLSMRSFSSIGGHGIIWMLVSPCLLYWGGDLWSLGLEVFESKTACSCIEVKGDIELRTGSDPLRIGEVSGEIDIGPGLVLHLFKSLRSFRMFSFVCRISLCSKPWLTRP